MHTAYLKLATAILVFGISVVKPKKLNLLDIFSVSLDNVTNHLASIDFGQSPKTKEI